MSNIKIAHMGGWGSSSTKRQNRLLTVIEEEMKPFDGAELIFSKRAMFQRHRAKRCLRKVSFYNEPENTLITCGKSLGAWNMVRYVINRMHELNYRKIFFLSVDPNYPLLWDWTPNLNHITLRLEKYLTKAVNLYVATVDPRQQAGALLTGPCHSHIKNIPLTHADHQSVATRPEVRQQLRLMFEEAADA